MFGRVVLYSVVRRSLISERASAIGQFARMKSSESESKIFEITEPSVAPYSFEGLSTIPFPPEIAEKLTKGLPQNEVEIKPDGMIYLPEIKYRRILNHTFGPGGWGLVPRSQHSLDDGILSREYALYCLGRFVSQARGEHQYFGKQGLATAQEAVKSNALVRCCKDLGIASELWDPAFIQEWKKTHAIAVPASNAKTGEKKKIWKRLDRTLDYPWLEIPTKN